MAIWVGQDESGQLGVHVQVVIEKMLRLNAAHAHSTTKSGRNAEGLSRSPGD